MHRNFKEDWTEASMTKLWGWKRGFLESRMHLSEMGKTSNETNQNKTPANKKQTHTSSILNIEMYIRQAKKKFITCKQQKNCYWVLLKYNRSRKCTSPLDCYIKQILGEDEVYSWFILRNKQMGSVWRNLGSTYQKPLLGCILHLLSKWQMEFNVC